MKQTQTVLKKWHIEGQLAVLYQIGENLLFHSEAMDPRFLNGEALTEEDIQASGAYKRITYFPEAVPSDAYIDLTSAWAI